MYPIHLFRRFEIIFFSDGGARKRARAIDEKTCAVFLLFLRRRRMNFDLERRLAGEKRSARVLRVEKEGKTTTRKKMI